MSKTNLGYINRFESPMMEEFERTLRGQGVVLEKQAKLAKQASLKNDNIDLSGNIDSDIPLIVAALRSEGFVSEANDIESNYVIFKKAETHLYKVFEESGNDIIEFAHKNDDGSITQTQDPSVGTIKNDLENQIVMLDTLKREPTGEYGSKSFAEKVASFLGFKKDAQTAAQNIDQKMSEDNTKVAQYVSSIVGQLASSKDMIVNPGTSLFGRLTYENLIQDQRLQAVLIQKDPSLEKDLKVIAEASKYGVNPLDQNAQKHIVDNAASLIPALAPITIGWRLATGDSLTQAVINEIGPKIVRAVQASNTKINQLLKSEADKISSFCQMYDNQIQQWSYYLMDTRNVGFKDYTVSTYKEAADKINQLTQKLKDSFASIGSNEGYLFIKSYYDQTANQFEAVINNITSKMMPELYSLVLSLIPGDLGSPTNNDQKQALSNAAINFSSAAKLWDAVRNSVIGKDDNKMKIAQENYSKANTLSSIASKYSKSGVLAELQNELKNIVLIDSFDDFSNYSNKFLQDAQKYTKLASLANQIIKNSFQEVSTQKDLNGKNVPAGHTVQTGQGTSKSTGTSGGTHGSKGSEYVNNEETDAVIHMQDILEDLAMNIDKKYGKEEGVSELVSKIKFTGQKTYTNRNDGLWKTNTSNALKAVNDFIKLISKKYPNIKLTPIKYTDPMAHKPDCIKYAKENIDTLRDIFAGLGFSSNKFEDMKSDYEKYDSLPTDGDLFSFARNLDEAQSDGNDLFAWNVETLSSAFTYISKYANALDRAYKITYEEFRSLLTLFYRRAQYQYNKAKTERKQDVANIKIKYSNAIINLIKILDKFIKDYDKKIDQVISIKEELDIGRFERGEHNNEFDNSDRTEGKDTKSNTQDDRPPFARQMQLGAKHLIVDMDQLRTANADEIYQLILSKDEIQSISNQGSGQPGNYIYAAAYGKLSSFLNEMNDSFTKWSQIQARKKDRMSPGDRENQLELFQDQSTLYKEWISTINAAQRTLQSSIRQSTNPTRQFGAR